MLHEREPTLDELLNEPIIRQVMAIDGYSPDDIRKLFQKAKARGNGAGLKTRSLTEAIRVPACICNSVLRAAKACCQPSA